MRLHAMTLTRVTNNLAAATTPGHWSEKARCKNLAATFDDADTHLDDKGRPRGEKEHPDVTEARRICRGCPVRELCLTDALAYGDSGDHGILGGTTPQERSAMRRKGRRTR